MTGITQGSGFRDTQPSNQTLSSTSTQSAAATTLSKNAVTPLSGW